MSSGSNTSGEARQAVYTLEQLQQAVITYDLYFNDPVPLSLLTAAAGSFRSVELMRILLRCIETREPVDNWSEFSVSFLAESRHRQ